MNSDLIKRLARQAYEEACVELQVTDAATWYSDRGPTPERVNEKFAELIIQEAIQVLETASNKALGEFIYMGDDVPTSVHQSNLRAHFGVKLHKETL